MRPPLSTNAASVYRRMKSRQTAVVRELTREAVRVGRELNTEAKRIMNAEIYSVPIPMKAYMMPRGASGKRHRVAIRASTLRRLSRVAGKGKYGKWRRTGKLLGAEHVRTRGPLVFLINDARYAGHRYRLGASGGRRIKSPGVRSVQWQEWAVSRRRSYILQRRRAGVLRALSGR